MVEILQNGKVQDSLATKGEQSYFQSVIEVIHIRLREVLPRTAKGCWGPILL